MAKVAARSDFFIASAFVAIAAHAASNDVASRPPVNDCRWERLSDAPVGQDEPLFDEKTLRPIELE